VGDVSNVAEAYRKIVSAPVRLIFLEEIEHLISVDLLKQWVTLEDLPNEEGDLVPSIVVDTNAIQEYVEQFAEHVNRPPRDARFSYDVNSGKVSLRTPAESGYVFDAPTTARNVIDAAYTEPRVAEIAVLETRPAVTSRAFGNSDDVFLEIANSGTSVTGMPSGRLNNVIIAADRLNGVAIPPGEEFSFNHNLGLVDEAKGYDMVQIDQQQQPLRADPVGLGGGIEQLATSVFRAALWAGYPITERRAPAWRIGWVEPPVGLDASAGTARADLRFINDTKDIALLTAELDVLRKALMVRIYGKKGRSKRVVELQGPDVTNVTPAGGVIERRDDRLVAGTRVQVGWAREGAEAVVRRTVLQDGVEVLRDAFLSVYEPASDVIVVGTGKPEDGGE
jgi:vancomycin resistance protein YoaR